jgi:hypothetical protein
MIAEESAQLPVETSSMPIIGWRCWFVLPKEGLLRPIFKRGLAWKPRQTLEAICPENIHAVPADGCKCGVWTVCHPLMLHEPEWMTAPPLGIGPIPGVLVVGQVALWGDIIEHERGWRGQFAYPTHLYLFADDELLASQLREQYAVPVTWGAQADELRKLLPRTRATPTLSAATMAPAGATPTRATPGETILALMNRLDDGPLRRLVSQRANRYEYGLCDDGEGLKYQRKWRDQARARLEKAQARGGYYTKTYGEAWRAALISQVKHHNDDLVLRLNGQNAAGGNKTAARRVAWLLIARRWTEAKSLARELEALKGQLKRRRHLYSGKRLAPTTILQRKAQFEAKQIHLENMLADLAMVPTPSYREWRTLTGS